MKIGLSGFGAGDISKIAVQIRECLGTDFDVVAENDHLHIEWQVKQPLTG